MTRQTILVVEDAVESLELMASFLESNGLNVLRATNAAEMRRVLRTATPSLILLDVNLPDADGIALAREMHLGGASGLIFVTSRNTDEDIIAGLEAGGDDYVTKPINPHALLARIRSVLRRLGDTVVTFDGWILDTVRRELFRPTGEMVELTSGEFNILAALVAQRPHPVSRDFLLDVISNRDPREISVHTVDTLVGRLRRKMCTAEHQSPIATIRGVGYVLGGNH